MKRIWTLFVALLAVWALLLATIVGLLARLVWLVYSVLLMVAKLALRAENFLREAALGIMDTARDWIRWATR